MNERNFRPEADQKQAKSTAADAKPSATVDGRESVPVAAEKTVTLTFFSSVKKAHGQRRTLSWTRLFKTMAEIKTTPKTQVKEALPGWCPATFRIDRRKKENVIEVVAAVFDFDNSYYLEEPQDGEIQKGKRPLDGDLLVTIDKALAALPGVLRFVYTSWSHTPAWPHFRLVVPYNHPVSGVQQERIWAHLAANFAAAGITIDTQCKDASRFWFLYAKRNENHTTRLEPGTLFDVDYVLGEIAPAKKGTGENAEPIPRAEPVADVDLSDGIDVADVPESNRGERASKYLATMPGAVSGAKGHKRLFNAAIVLVRGFALSQELALAILKNEYNQRCKPPWTDKELTHKVKDAARNTSRELGYLLRRPKKRTPSFAADISADSPLEGSRTERSFPCTDLGNAERLIHQHGQNLHFCDPWNKWLVWTGTRWHKPDQREVERFAQLTVRSVYKEAADETNPDRRKALAGHAPKSEANARLMAMVEQAKSLPGVPILPDELDRDPWILNVQNGTVDLKTGTLREHRKEDLITKITSTEFDPNATCPLYDSYLARVLPDPEVRELVNRLDGYGLTGVVYDHILPIHFGDGRNGKGVHVNTVLHVMGDYAQQIPSALLMAKREAHPTEKTTLFGIRLAMAAETKKNSSLNVAFVKQATGGDRISARRMREDFWAWNPTHKIQLSTNNRPIIDETKDAIWERVLLIPWKVLLPEPERDVTLTEKLKAEAPGILAKLVRACLAWQTEGLAIPETVRAATRSYRAEEDTVGRWISECCVVGERVSEEATPLLESFNEWAESNKEKELSQKVFGSNLHERGFESGRDPKTRRTRWRGICLRDGSAMAESAGKSEVDIDEEEISQFLQETPKPSRNLQGDSEGRETIQKARENDTSRNHRNHPEAISILPAKLNLIKGVPENSLRMVSMVSENESVDGVTPHNYSDHDPSFSLSPPLADPSGILPMVPMVSEADGVTPHNYSDQVQQVSTAGTSSPMADERVDGIKTYEPLTAAEEKADDERTYREVFGHGMYDDDEADEAKDDEDAEDGGG